VYCTLPADAAEPGSLQDAIRESISDMVELVQEYVPGYSLRVDPQFDAPREDWGGLGRVGIWIEVRGAGDYLPEYAGNLDIITAAAVRTGDLLASKQNGKGA
jgi:acetaldehyde dehydrogenase